MHSLYGQLDYKAHAIDNLFIQRQYHESF